MTATSGSSVATVRLRMVAMGLLLEIEKSGVSRGRRGHHHADLLAIGVPGGRKRGRPFGLALCKVISLARIMGDIEQLPAIPEVDRFPVTLPDRPPAEQFAADLLVGRVDAPGGTEQK